MQLGIPVTDLRAGGSAGHARPWMARAAADTLGQENA